MLRSVAETFDNTVEEILNKEEEDWEVEMKDNSCQESNKRPKLTNEQVTVQKICLFEKFSHRKYYSFVMNEAQLSARIDKYLKMEWSELDDYTSVQFTQDVDLGLCEMNMPKYWEQLAIEFKIEGSNLIYNHYI